MNIKILPERKEALQGCARPLPFSQLANESIFLILDNKREHGEYHYSN